MKKNYLKLVPATLLVALLAACNNGGNPSTSTSDPETPVEPVNGLEEWVNGLSGEVSVEEFNGLFEEGVLDSHDQFVTQSAFEYEDFAPRWAYVDGRTEEEYAEWVHHKVQAGSFKRHSNDVIAITQEYICAPYNKDLEDEDPEYPEKIDYDNIERFKDDIIIFEQENVTNYVMTRDGDPANVWSFVARRDSEEGLMKELGQQGGLTGDIVNEISYVEEAFAYYANAYAANYSSEESFVANAKDGVLVASYTGNIDITPKPVPLEVVWGNTPAEKAAFAGLYMKQYLSFYYDIEISNGVVSYFEAGEYGIARTILKDKNWKSGDPTPSYPLTDEQAAALDLYVPETIPWPYDDNGKAVSSISDITVIENQYVGGYTTFHPFTTFACAESSAKVGSYLKTLPTISDYRDEDGTDEGFWINVQNFLAWESEY